MNQKTLLVVDDEEDITDIVDITFSSYGWKVLTASNGLGALTQLERENIDVVLTDVRMPVMDGEELLKNIRDKKIRCPLIYVMTGYSTINKAALLELGAMDLISKPFDPDLLRCSIETAYEKIS